MKWNPINNMGDCPTMPGEYLVTADWPSRPRQAPQEPAPAVLSDYWNGHQWRVSKNVVAWMEYPGPYEPPGVVQLEIEDVIHEPRKEGS